MRGTRRTDVSKWSGLASTSKLGRHCFRNQAISSLIPAVPLKCPLTAQFTSAVVPPFPFPLSPSPRVRSCWSRPGLHKSTVTVCWYLHFTGATGKKTHKAAPDICYKATAVLVKWQQGVQNTTELGTRCKDCSPHHLFQSCLNHGLFLHRQITFHAITDFQFSLWSRHRKFRAETNGLWGWNKNALLSTTYWSTFSLITWKCLGQQSSSQWAQSNQQLDWHCFLNHAEVRFPPPPVDR